VREQANAENLFAELQNHRQQFVLAAIEVFKYKCFQLIEIELQECCGN